MLADPNVWVDAAVQVFYSIGVGFGVHLTYASFNKFNNNCYRDCLITASVNSLTSFYSGFVIFTYLGYMAHSMNKEIQNVASEGYGLVFQVYPEAISTLPFAKFWSILFFFMLLTLGIDSAMGGLEAVITGLMDEFKLHTWVKREVFTALVIFGSFVGALVNCTQVRYLKLEYKMIYKIFFLIYRVVLLLWSGLIHIRLESRYFVRQCLKHWQSPISMVYHPISL